MEVEGRKIFAAIIIFVIVMSALVIYSVLTNVTNGDNQTEIEPGDNLNCRPEYNSALNMPFIKCD